MAYKNKIIRNPKTGQSIKFLKTAKETGGQLLEMESIYDNISKEPAPHYHPYQEENFAVLEGELTAKIDGVVKVLTKGETLNISPNTVHSVCGTVPVKERSSSGK